MSVLVTGAAGYIGSHIILALHEAGEEVIAIDDLSSGSQWRWEGKAHFVRGSLLDSQALETCFSIGRPDTIIHLAGSIEVAESVADPLKYYRNNCSATELLLEWAIKFQVPNIIFSSSAAVYKSDNELLGENSLLGPASPYGRSKRMCEEMLEDCAQAGLLRYVILRYFNVAGADPQGRTGQSGRRSTHLIKRACEVATGKREHLNIFGNDYPTPDGTAIRDYLHVTDLTNAHMLAMGHLREKQTSLTLNCGYGRGNSVFEVVQAVKKQSGRDFPTALSPRRPGDPPRLVASAERIREELGWQPQYDRLELIINHALAFERALI